MNNIREELVTKFRESDPVDAAERLQSADGESIKIRSPTLTEGDVDFVSQNKVKMSQKDILKKHVSNWADLDLKQRRKVMAHIQS